MKAVPPRPEPPPWIPDGPAPNGCCWPLTADRPWRFCANRRLPGRAYCPEHQKIAYAGRFRIDAG